MGWRSSPAARRTWDSTMLGCGEHVMFHVPTANTYISLAVAAGATTRIRLLSAVVLLPLYPAALAAKMGAALDVASNGRYLFGVGVGGEFPKEFEGVRGNRCGNGAHARTRHSTSSAACGRNGTCHTPGGSIP